MFYISLGAASWLYKPLDVHVPSYGPPIMSISPGNSVVSRWEIKGFSMKFFWIFALLGTLPSHGRSRELRHYSHKSMNAIGVIVRNEFGTSAEPGIVPGQKRASVWVTHALAPPTRPWWPTQDGIGMLLNATQQVSGVPLCRGPPSLALRWPLTFRRIRFQVKNLRGFASQPPLLHAPAAVA